MVVAIAFAWLDQSRIMAGSPAAQVAVGAAASGVCWSSLLAVGLVDAEDTGGSCSAMHIHSPGGTGPRPHLHEAAEEVFFLLSGQVTFHTGEAEFHASGGDLIHVPRGTTHHFVVDSDDATYLAFYVPGGDERGFREAAVSEEDAGDTN